MAGAEAAVRAGVEPAAGLVGRRCTCRRRTRSRRRRRPRRRRGRGAGAARRRPRVGLIGSASAAEQRRRRRRRRRRSASRSRAIHGSWSAPGAGVVGEAGEDGGEVAGGRRPPARRGRPAGRGCRRRGRPAASPKRAEREPEVERRADDDDDVGLGLEQPPGAAEGELVVGGQAAPPEAVDERRDPQRLDRRPQGVPRAVPPHVAAGDERRPLGPGEERGGPSDLVGIGLGADGRRRPSGTSASPEANTTSSGKSRNTGPRCGRQRP